MSNLVIARLLIVMLAPFAFATSAFVFGGVLTEMAIDLEVSIATAGQLQAAFALTCAVVGPLLARRIGPYDRKRVLIGVMVALMAMNILSALAGAFGALLAARVAAGFVAAVTMPVASSIALAMAPASARPTALAIVFSGIAFSLLIGIPAGSVVGGLFGWPACFWFAASLCAVAALAALFGLPPTPAPETPPSSAFRRALQGGTAPLYVATFFSFAATFASVAYVGPAVTAISGLSGAGVGAVQVFVGVGALAGLAIGARLAQGAGVRALPGLLAVTVCAQALVSVGMQMDLGAIVGYLAAIFAFGLGSGALFALSPIVQNALAERAGAAVTVAFAVNGSMIYLGQGAGALIGGLVTDGFALESVGYAGAAVAAAGAIGVALAGRSASSTARRST